MRCPARNPVPAAVGATAAALCLLAAGSGPAGAAQQRAGMEAEAGRPPATVSLDLADVPLRQALHRVESVGRVRVAYSPDLLPVERRVTLRVEDARPVDALRRLVGNLGVEVRRIRGRQFVLEPAGALDPSRPAGGVVAGRVARARDGGPVEGAVVRVRGTDLGAVTGENGRFAVAPVPPGGRVLFVDAVGFRSAERRVDVPEGDTVRVRVTLRASRMEELVITGTRSRTARSRRTTPVTVLDEDAVRRADPTVIADLFEDNRVPGVVSLDGGVDSEFNQKILIRGVSSPFATQSPCVKLLVDGRETQVRALGSIGSANVERVEVVRGPQASTLYGSDASCGVIQVFTRDGSEMERERVTAGARFAATESPWVDGTPTSRELRLDVAGPLGGGSYGVSAGYTDRDGFVPNYDREVRRASFAFRRALGDRLDLRASVRFFHKNFGSPGAAGTWFDLFRAGKLPSDVRIDANDSHEFRSLNVGLTAEYSPAPWWSHRLTVGDDFSRFQSTRPPAPGEDSLKEVATTRRETPGVRYTSTLVPEIEGPVSATLVAGADWGGREFEHTGSTFVETPSAREPTRSGVIDRSEVEKSAVFGQLRVGAGRRLTATVGVRGDHHSNFGEAFGDWSVNPRLGLAYVIDLGPGASLKPRASWGTGINAPTVFARDGSAPAILPNPAIAPERTEGWEAGADLEAPGVSLRAEATYYRQRTDNAIVARLVEFPSPFRLDNAGEVSNDGLELFLEWSPRPLRVSANFTWMDNEVVSLPEGRQGANEVGEPVSDPVVPRTSGGLRIVYGAGSWIGGSRPADLRLGLGVTYTGDRWALDWEQLWSDERAGRPAADLSVYNRWFDGFAKADASARYRVGDGVSLGLRVDNVFDSLAEPKPTFVVPGRSVEMSLRARL